jgi:polygalacturonase
VKASVGTTGKINKVAYTGITLSSIPKYVASPFPSLSSHINKPRYGVLIEQNYDGGDLYGTADTGVPITGLTLSNITGTNAVSSSGYDVVVTCGSSTSCTGWT